MSQEPIKNKSFAIYSLGCKLNFSESSLIENSFLKHNFLKKSFNSKADIYIVNTCTVTSNADKKSRNAIAKAKKNNPNAITIITGCYSQLEHEQIKTKYNVDFILGSNDKDKIDDIIKQILLSDKNKKYYITPTSDINEFSPAFSTNNRTRAFLKVQDGCNYNCSYCAVPLARGKSRNQSIKDCIKDIKKIAENNINEIVITGVNIGDFGKSTGESFTELLKEISKIQEIKRFRIGSIEPDLLNKEIINIVSQSKNIMPHFHIPLQSGSNRVLKLMKRRYSTDLFEEKTELINAIIPDAFIGIDIIAGINGETEKDFAETMNLLKRVKVSDIHCFQYSERKGTPATDFKPKISAEEKKSRADIIKIEATVKQIDFINNNISKTKSVLVESRTKNSEYTGFSENYIKVFFKSNNANIINSIVPVSITGIETRSNKNVALGKAL